VGQKDRFLTGAARQQEHAFEVKSVLPGTRGIAPEAGAGSPHRKYTFPFPLGLPRTRYCFRSSRGWMRVVLGT
jgi:hypothetical protein